MAADFKMARIGGVIPYYSYMNSSPKIRVNPCESVSKSELICLPFVVIQRRRVLICGKSFHFENFFMQNEPNFQKAEISLIPYMSNGYENLSATSADKNKAKTKPNEPNSNPNQSQSNPIFC